ERGTGRLQPGGRGQVGRSTWEIAPQEPLSPRPARPVPLFGEVGDVLVHQRVQHAAGSRFGSAVPRGVEPVTQVVERVWRKSDEDSPTDLARLLAPLDIDALDPQVQDLLPLARQPPGLDRAAELPVVVEELGDLAGFLRVAGEHSVPGVLAVEVAAQLDPDLVQRAGLEGQALSQVLPAGAQGQRERGQTGLVHLKVIDELPGTRTKPFLVAGR